MKLLSNKNQINAGKANSTKPPQPIKNRAKTLINQNQIYFNLKRSSGKTNSHLQDVSCLNLTLEKKCVNFSTETIFGSQCAEGAHTGITDL
jgi:hypothetical protein